MECVVVAVAHDVRARLGRIQSGVNVVTRTGLICISRAAHIYLATSVQSRLTLFTCLGYCPEAALRL